MERVKISFFWIWILDDCTNKLTNYHNRGWIQETTRLCKLKVVLAFRIDFINAFLIGGESYVKSSVVQLTSFF